MTSSQRRVLEALIEATRDGWPAGVREVARVAGYRSPAYPHLLLSKLEAQGLAVRHPRSRDGGWLPRWQPYQPMALSTEDFQPHSAKEAT